MSLRMVVPPLSFPLILTSALLSVSPSCPFSPNRPLSFTPLPSLPSLLPIRMSCASRLVGHSGTVQSLVLGPDVMVTGSRDRQIKVRIHTHTCTAYTPYKNTVCTACCVCAVHFLLSSCRSECLHYKVLYCILPLFISDGLRRFIHIQ